MPLRDYVKKNLVSCAPDTAVTEIALLMKDQDVGAVLVVEEKRPLGIVTDRDIVMRCLAEGIDSKSAVAEDIMSPAVESVSEEGGIYDVVQKMHGAWVRRVVVVNSRGEATGLLSFDDVFELIADEIGTLREVIQPQEPKIEIVA